MAIDDNASYELTGYQVKDLASKIRAKADSNSLASVATSGLYSDLTGAPTIPTVYNGTLTIQQNGTTLGTFSANQDTNETINITGGGGNATKYYIGSDAGTIVTFYKDSGLTTAATYQEVIDALAAGEVMVYSTKTNSGTTTDTIYVAGSYSVVNNNGGYTISLATLNDRSYSYRQFSSQSGISNLNANAVFNNSARFFTQDMVGATSSANGRKGYVPQPLIADKDKFLKGDGTWTAVSSGSSYTAGNGISIDANNEISIDDTVVAEVSDLPTNFTGATSSVAGANGLVPAPAAGDEAKALHGDGTWKDTTAKLVEISYGESNAWAKFIAAYNAGSIVYCRASSNANPGTGSQTRKAFMAYVNNATNPTNVEFQYVRSQSSKTDSQQCDQVFVYKLTNASGGTWTVESRNMGPKIVAGTGMSSTFTTGANATITLNAEPNYSTSEVDTKVKWVDGKTIYRKTINFGSLPDTTSKIVAHGVSNLSKVIKMEGYAYRSGDGTFFPIPFASEIAAQNSIALTVSTTDVVVSTGMNRSNIAECYITIYYTKSS